ncbi:MAG: hypothetical protein HYV32_02610 [Candidatus Kerfeldbacteria bacterium]|nr:hypothetical protein [Candidatus Kerfeldbacteria bacterium]
MNSNEIAQILGSGKSETQPFGFRVLVDPTEGFERYETVWAENGGLRAFLRKLEEIVAHYGWGAVKHHNHNNDFASYFTHLGVQSQGSALHQIQALVRNLETQTQGPSRWARTANVYQIFPRAFNLSGWREFHDRPPGTAKPFFEEWAAEDFETLNDLGFDTVWLMGTFPIGKRGAKGGETGNAGSPYATTDHQALELSLGTEADFKRFVDMAHECGVRVILDIIPNHTSLDSRLLREHPEWFLHHTNPVAGETAPFGSFEHIDGEGKLWWIRLAGCEYYGKLTPWWDVAQLNLAHPAVREYVVTTACRWIRDFGIDGYRIDMAYQLLNSYYSRNWKVQMPERELLEQMITAVRELRPDAGFFGEAYGREEDLFLCGCDTTLQKCTWLDGLRWHQGRGCNVERIRKEIRNAATIHAQTDGPGGYIFVGNHDEMPHTEAYGPWTRGCAVLTICQPNGLLIFNGQEIEFSQQSKDDWPKPIPFTRPVKIDWAGADPETARFYRWVFRTSKSIREELGDVQMHPLEDLNGNWVGYALTGKDTTTRYLVIANPTDRATMAHVYHTDLGINHSTPLMPYGYKVVRV